MKLQLVDNSGTVINELELRDPPEGCDLIYAQWGWQESDILYGGIGSLLLPQEQSTEQGA